MSVSGATVARRLSPWRARAISALAGALGALALAPFDAWFLLVPAFAVICLGVARMATAREAARLAWWAGLGWFALAMHWIVKPFFVEPEIHGWMAPFALLLMAGGLALFWALAGWIAARLSPPGAGRILAFVGVLTLIEAVRGRVFTGLPWAQPGHGWIASDALALAPFIGPLGLTLLAIALAGATAILALSPRPALGALPILVGVGLGLAPLTPAALPTAEGAPVVRIVQINAPQHLKWDRDMIPVFFQRALSLTGAGPGGQGRPDLVIWPETSLPTLLADSAPDRARIAEAAGGAEVVLGAQRYAGAEPRNILLHLAADGAIAAIYDKHHLVPFGEYLPLRGVTSRLGWRGLAQRLSGGYYPGAGPGTLDLGGLGRAFPMICYELIFPRYIRAVDRPDYMINLTNDAWFGSFAMPHQHLALARLRAAEQGLPVIRSANTGVSAMIDGRGVVLRALPMDVEGVIDVPLPPPRPATVYARTGDLPALILAVFATAAGLLIGRRSAPH